MSKRESKIELSQSGKARKDAMLGQLEQELSSVHHKRRQRKAVAKGVGVVALVAIAGLAWPFLVSDVEHPVAEPTTSTLSPLRSSVVLVGNVEGIYDRCVVANSDNSAAFEAMADDELLAMLAAVGAPSVLGEIDGKVRVIPDAAPLGKQVNPL